jgi:hypothetical protein
MSDFKFYIPNAHPLMTATRGSVSFAIPGVQCTSPVQEPSEGGASALMRLWAEAKGYQTTLPIKPQDALCCVVGEEFYQGSTQGL